MAQAHDMPDTKAAAWRKWLLVGSLGVNLLVVGLVAGMVLGGGPDWHRSRLDLTIGPLTRAMAEQDRAAVQAQLRSEGAFDRRARAAMRADMGALLASLRADTFDAQAFRTAVLRQRARLAAGQDRVLLALTQHIAAMTPEARAAYADRLEGQLRRRDTSRERSDDRSGR